MSVDESGTPPQHSPRHAPRAKMVGGVVAVLVVGGLVAALGQQPHQDAQAAPDPGDLLAASVTEIDLAALLDPTVPDRVLSVGGPVPQELPSPTASPTASPKAKRAEPTPSPSTVTVPPDAEYLAHTLSEEGVPLVSLRAYQRAAATMQRSAPRCGLTWHMIAAVGRVESNHGASGRAVTPDGTLVYPILGPRLDGTRFASIPDTDGGRYDGDTVWDRAVGPMQFIPGTWARLGADGNGDGARNPQNLYDAALATATYLCLYDRNLAKPQQLRDAYFAYNRSTTYVDAVMGFYQAFVLADSGALARPTLPQVTDKPKPPPPPPSPTPSTRPTKKPQAPARSTAPAPKKAPPAASATPPRPRPLPHRHKASKADPQDSPQSTRRPHSLTLPGGSEPGTREVGSIRTVANICPCALGIEKGRSP